MAGIGPGFIPAGGLENMQSSRDVNTSPSVGGLWEQGLDLPCVQRRFYNPHHYPRTQNSDFNRTDRRVSVDQRRRV